MFVQKNSRLFLHISLFVFGVFFLSVFVLGVVLHASHLNDYGFCLSCGIVGVLSCVLEFFGAKFNQDNISHKRLFKAFTILFFVSQIIIHFLLFLAGMVFRTIKNMINTFVEYRVGVLVGNDFSLMGGVGVFCIIVAIFIIGFIILAVVHSGFVFSVKIFIATLAILEILISISLVVLLLSQGFNFITAVPSLIFSFCALIGLFLVFRKNRKNIKCTSICYSVFTGILSGFAILFLFIAVVARSSLPSYFDAMCDPVQTPDQTTCADLEKALLDAFCGSEPESDRAACENTFNEDTLIAVLIAGVVAVINLLIFFLVYCFLGHLLPSTLSCVLCCVEKGDVEPEVEHAQPHPPADPYNEAGVPLYPRGRGAGAVGFDPPPGFAGPPALGYFGPPPPYGPGQGGFPGPGRGAYVGPYEAGRVMPPVYSMQSISPSSSANRAAGQGQGQEGQWQGQGRVQVQAQAQTQTQRLGGPQPQLGYASGVEVPLLEQGDGGNVNSERFNGSIEAGYEQGYIPPRRDVLGVNPV